VVNFGGTQKTSKENQLRYYLIILRKLLVRQERTGATSSKQFPSEESESSKFGQQGIIQTIESVSSCDSENNKVASRDSSRFEADLVEEILAKLNASPKGS